MAKSWLQKLIDKLADANQKQYGDMVPDCCADGRTEPRKRADQKKTG